MDRVSRLVRVKLTDGSEVKGRIFLRQGDRVLDLLNDERMFIPFENDETSISVLNKTAIMGIFDDLNQSTGVREQRKDPRAEDDW
ncbi:MAG: hypothetical protein P8X52_00205 [Limibacillus sp.]